jgi:hypothetical protein
MKRRTTRYFHADLSSTLKASSNRSYASHKDTSDRSPRRIASLEIPIGVRDSKPWVEIGVVGGTHSSN